MYYFWLASHKMFDLQIYNLRGPYKCLLCSKSVVSSWWYWSKCCNSCKAICKVYHVCALYSPLYSILWWWKLADANKKFRWHFIEIDDYVFVFFFKIKVWSVLSRFMLPACHFHFRILIWVMKVFLCACMFMFVRPCKKML
jgi:hypothetical protein